MAGRCCHSISDVVKTALLTYLCGGEDYDDMSAYITWNHRLVGQEALTYKDNEIQNIPLGNLQFQRGGCLTLKFDAVAPAADRLHTFVKDGSDLHPLEHAHAGRTTKKECGRWPHSKYLLSTITPQQELI